LHGGPGMSETSLFRYFNASVLEKTFTVVYWDQRGAGRTYARDTPEASMTIERFVADLDELVDAVRAKLDKKKVVILGHSWGSALGTLYAARFPDKVSAYVGTGQIGDVQKSEHLSYAFVLAEAERRNNRRALKQLRAIGEPPYTSKTIGTQRRWLMRFVVLMRGKSFWQVLRASRSTPESSLRQIPSLFRGAMFSLRTLWSQVSVGCAVEATRLVRGIRAHAAFRGSREVQRETGRTGGAGCSRRGLALIQFRISGRRT
jgi:pimeloyl-ACP methyl ester carboxylesterase